MDWIEVYKCKSLISERSHWLPLVLHQDLHCLNTTIICEPWYRAQQPQTTPCTQSVQGVIIYRVIKHQIILVQKKLLFFSSEAHRDLSSNLITSALNEITQFSGISHEVTSTIDYSTSMPWDCTRRNEARIAEHIYAQPQSYFLPSSLKVELCLLYLL